jgi:hypothetical protein
VIYRLSPGNRDNTLPSHQSALLGGHGMAGM